MEEQHLVLVGDRARAVCSSSTALAVQQEPEDPSKETDDEAVEALLGLFLHGARRQAPAPVVDANGYYAALGVPVTATRRELFEAYRDMESPDAWATYAFKQLRDREVRAAYDAVPEGGTFLDDYTRDEVNRRVNLAVARFRAAGHLSVTVSDIFSSLGIGGSSSIRSFSGDFLDTADPQGFDGRRSSPSQTGRPGADRWRYSYYRMGTACDDVARLASWQGSIAVALAGCESVPSFSVGFHAATSDPFLVERVGGIPVFLLHAEMNSSPGLIHEAIAKAL